MITEQDLQAAIAECQGKRKPDAATCIKLAAFYTILDHIDDRQPTGSYSFASFPQEPEPEPVIDYYAESDFSRAISGRDVNEILSIIDELMDTLQVVNPRLYAGVMRKIAE